jgi:hypothetical protein
MSSAVLSSEPLRLPGVFISLKLYRIHAIVKTREPAVAFVTVPMPNLVCHAVGG